MSHTRLNAALDLFSPGIFPGDTLNVTAKVKESVPDGDKTRMILDVALVNQEGVSVTVGTASGLIEG